MKKEIMITYSQFMDAVIELADKAPDSRSSTIVTLVGIALSAKLFSEESDKKPTPLTVDVRLGGVQ